jgi:radical SAM superfamily enzyme YgiQ (UPF0313 family)
LKILLVYPKYPDTFWSFRHALSFISKKACFPPLGLLTVAAMLPSSWEKKLIDMNITTLHDEDIKWADYVFISAMNVQQTSTSEVIARCNRLKAKVVAGGPLFTTAYDSFSGVDHFILGEAEVTLPPFINDLENGCVKKIYISDEKPQLDNTPIPLWSLIDKKQYATMNIQYSRGCPFDCEFCDIIFLNGHQPRTKGKGQILKELDSLYDSGWRGGVFIVDDNFIGNKKKLKAEILPALAEWLEKKKYPFFFYTEASINLADDEELMELMGKAGFSKVFIGIETPNEESLNECNKWQNKGRDLASSIKKMQNYGFEVQGGFIVGFDNDPLSIFKSQINFIEKTGIVTAMVGLLNAPKGTKLYQRLKKENRLVTDFTGDNTDCSLNFIPKMKTETLIDGYKHILHTIYSPKQYYQRISTFLKEYHPPKLRILKRFQFYHIPAFFRVIWILGIIDKGRRHFWQLFVTTLFRRPKLLAISFNLAVFGLHFRKVSEKVVGTSVRRNPAPDSVT